MSFVFTPTYQLWIHHPAGYGQKPIRASYRINQLIRADLSLYVTNMVNTANVEVADPDGSIWRDVSPQPMDILQLYSTSPVNPHLVVLWTGYIDTAETQFDPTSGNTVVISATSAWKMFEVTRFTLTGRINDAKALAMRELHGGIGARALIEFAASRVKYPGAMASLPHPAGLPLYTAPEIAGQEIYALPDNIATEPDLQTWASILGALSTDTGCELYFDEFSSLIFRPLGFLNPSPPPRPLRPEYVLGATVGLSDAQVVTAVRVRWWGSANFNQDGYWYAGQTKPAPTGVTVQPTAPDGLFANTTGTMMTQLGVRELTVQAPWIKNRTAANYLAQAIGQMSAANVAIGSVTIACDPAFRVGTLVQVPPFVLGTGYSTYYIAGVVHSLQWNGPWTTTLQLAYGRDPSQTFPYQEHFSRAIVNNQPNFPDASAVLSGVPGYTSTASGKGPGFAGPGADTTSYSLVQVPGIGQGDAAAPYPVGTTIRIYDAAGHPIAASSANGEYLVTQTTTDNTIQLANTQGQTQTGTVVVVANGQAGSGTSNGPQASQQTTSQTTGAVPDSGAGSSATGAVGVLATWPVRGATTANITQQFGPVGPQSGEVPYTYTAPTDTAQLPGDIAAQQGTSYAHFHTGIDLAVAYGSPVISPVNGVVVANVPGGQTNITNGVDTTGYGNAIVVQSGDLYLLFAHLSSEQVQVGSIIQVGSLLGAVGNTGNVYPPPGTNGNPYAGTHLHFGVYDSTYGSWVDPLLYLNGLSSS